MRQMIRCWGFPVAGFYALAFLLLTIQVAQAQTVQTTPDTFESHLAAAGPGTVLLLSPGDYGFVSLRRAGGSPQAPIILRSADPEQPAVISEMMLRQVQNLTLDGIVFDHEFEEGDVRHLRPFQVLSSENIAILNSRFDGDTARNMSPADDGFPAGFGIGVRDTQGFVFENNEISMFYRGLVVSQSQDVVVASNDLHGIRMDGMNFAEVVNVRIEDNHIHDFARSINSADHSDMIQFWTNGTDSPSRNIIIRNNILNSGQGLFTQSIFMRNDMVDRGLAGEEMFYQNVLIEGNVILNAHLHGITIGETAGLNIINNTVVRNATSEGERDNPPLYTPQIRVAEISQDVLIARNVTSKVTGYDGQVSWLLDGNFFVQDRTRLEAGFYATVFGPEALANPRDIFSFRPLASGPIGGSDIGAPMLNAN